MIEFKSSEATDGEFFEFTTKKGMKIKLREPNTMEALYFANVLTYSKDDQGNSLDRNGNLLSSSFLGGMHAFLSVREIDGIPQPGITNKLVFEALEKKLGNDGCDAVLEAYASMRQKMNETESLDAVKK